MKRFRPRLTYANVVATLALFLALGGAAVAAGLPKNSVGKAQIKKGAVTTKALANKSVTSGKIAPKAVTAGKLGPNAVLPGNLGAGIISTSKIAAGAVTAEKIKNNVVTTNKLNNKAVTSAKLAEKAVTTANLNELAVTGAKIANETITKEKLAKGAYGNVETLKSGQTERGVFSLGGTAAAAGDTAHGAISFQWLLAANPTTTVVIPSGGPYTTQCPGLGSGNTTPEAAAGYVCLYLTTETALETLTAESTRLGALLTAKAKEAGDLTASGVWATTAS
ncbi:MAG: hypothetical protein QM729_00780 [Solirubrobacterales bacterium]